VSPDRTEMKGCGQGRDVDRLIAGGQRVVVFSFLFAALSTTASAQELVPAAYTPAPVGVNLVTTAGAFSNGEVSFDPSLPVEGASASVTAWSVSFGRSFGLFGRASAVTLIAPFVFGDVEGVYLGEQTSLEQSGFGDAVLRLAVNLFGAPAMDREEFGNFRPGTLVGTSLAVRIPTGDYDPSKAINIGANRWSFKPQIGVIHVVQQWAFDVYVGGWFFTENSDFIGGKTRIQDPMLSTQVHVRYFVNRGLWAALNGNFWLGGTTRIDGAGNDDLQRNSRAGLTVAWRFAPQHSVRFAGSLGAFTRVGGDFTSVGLSYSYSWW
jgi:hypothetical protein